MNGLSHDDARRVLGLMLTPGIGNRTLHRVLARAFKQADGLAILDDPDDETISEALELPTDLVSGFRASCSDSESLLDQLEGRRVVLLAFGTGSYPARLARALGTRGPAVLFAVGNLAILERPGIGFCGSRRSSELGLTLTYRYAAAIGQRGWNVISGYASGVDSAAHAAALESGGSTIIVLAEGIVQFRMKQQLGEIADEVNTLVLSEFPPGIPWIARNAMQRNHTICGLSSALVIVESSMNGGTFEAGTFAQSAGCPLFVVDFERPLETAPGNPHFLQRGAIPLSADPEDDGGIDAILTVAAQSENWTADASRAQRDLFARSDRTP